MSHRVVRAIHGDDYTGLSQSLLLPRVRMVTTISCQSRAWMTCVCRLAQFTIRPKNVASAFSLKLVRLRWSACLRKYNIQHAFPDLGLYPLLTQQLFSACLIHLTHSTTEQSLRNPVTKRIKNDHKLQWPCFDHERGNKGQGVHIFVWRESGRSRSAGFTRWHSRRTLSKSCF